MESGYLREIQHITYNMEKSIKLHSLPLDQVRTYGVVALLTAGNLALPFVCHLIPQGGLIFLPIYFFTLFGAYKYGLRAGLLIGILSPVVNHLLTGMPPAAVLPAILVKSCLIALAASWAARKYGRVSLLILAGVVLAYQVTGGLAEWALTGSFAAAVQDFRLAWPGMLLQVFGVYAVIRTMARYNY